MHSSEPQNRQWVVPVVINWTREPGYFTPTGRQMIQWIMYMYQKKKTGEEYSEVSLKTNYLTDCIQIVNTNTEADPKCMIW